MIDIPVGGVYEEWVRLHDFDGRRLVISRGQFEPAMAEETFLLINLESGQIESELIVAGGSAATLTGPDTVWDGKVTVPNLGSRVGTLETDAGIASLPDGRVVGYLAGVDDSGGAIEFDLAVWFSGNEANIAARIDGIEGIPVPNDYYIRNESATALRLELAPEAAVTSVWFDYDGDPDLESEDIGSTT